jgi:peptidoglycan/LPS O-acetylase OafA/YrhL
MTGRIEYIDWARGYAIFTIVCYHALQRAALPPPVQQAIVFGGTGVHLFFLLSGFGLALSQHSVSAPVFYKRRLLKVWLPYVLALTISWLAASASGLFPDGFDAWLAGAGLYQMFSEKYIESFGGHFWFISAIVQFYLVFPLLAWGQNRLQRNGGPLLFVALALGVSVVWWLLVFFLDKGGSRPWNSCFLQFLWEFALGMALAKYLPAIAAGQQAGLHGRWWLSFPVGLFFSAVMVLMIVKMGAAGRIFNDIPALIGYGAFSIFFYGLGLKYWPLLRRFFLWVGGFSYSLYLVHILVLELWLRFFDAYSIPVNGLSLLPFLPLALLAGRLFEPLSRHWTGLFERKGV